MCPIFLDEDREADYTDTNPVRVTWNTTFPIEQIQRTVGIL